MLKCSIPYEACAHANVYIESYRTFWLGNTDEKYELIYVCQGSIGTRRVERIMEIERQAMVGGA